MVQKPIHFDVTFCAAQQSVKSCVIDAIEASNDDVVSSGGGGASVVTGIINGSVGGDIVFFLAGVVAGVAAVALIGFTVEERRETKTMNCF
jgi:hypothetical protein